jgi:hypothetical protein
LSFLRERYGVRGLNKQDIIIQFRRLGLWDVMVARFHEFASAQQTKATPR